ncbi:MAG: transposase [Candidatus Brocadia sp.]
MIDKELAIVMEGIKNEKSVAEICRENQINQSQYYKWRERFLEVGKRALINGSADDTVYNKGGN